MSSPQQGDLRLPGPPSVHGADGEARAAAEGTDGHTGPRRHDKAIDTLDLEFDPFDIRMKYTPILTIRNRFLTARSSLVLLRWRAKARANISAETFKHLLTTPPAEGVSRETSSAEFNESMITFCDTPAPTARNSYIEDAGTSA
ncbi:Egf-like module-containing mucin-like hormone receptor-like 1 [Plakobranchus ocellatus]|uniref:Egf-like module-containing mucin-like hormone receptor-like 1 n=1 Tax=Plakobranchus ocellatus TaxID=259542 RepID=A0AAV4BSP1_9GAST|nr:Egf-like module-containing mucin-like hormone receptor-like 1 [Plakobranchus ocellatus]